MIPTTNKQRAIVNKARKALLKKQKQNKNVKKKTNVAKSIPYAQGTSSVVMQPRINGGQIMNFTNREMVADVFANSGPSTQNCRIIGTGFSPILANIASSFEEYKFRYMVFEYEPTCSASKDGLFIMKLEYDTTDPLDSTIVGMKTQYRSSACSVYQRRRMPVDMGRVIAYNKGWMRTGRDDLAYLQFATYGQASGDTALCGTIYVSYSVDLRIPCNHRLITTDSNQKCTFTGKSDKAFSSATAASQNQTTGGLSDTIKDVGKAVIIDPTTGNVRDWVTGAVVRGVGYLINNRSTNVSSPVAQAILRVSMVARWPADTVEVASSTGASRKQYIAVVMSQTSGLDDFTILQPTNMAYSSQLLFNYQTGTAYGVLQEPNCGVAVAQIYLVQNANTTNPWFSMELLSSCGASLSTSLKEQDVIVNIERVTVSSQDAFEGYDVLDSNLNVIGTYNKEVVTSMSLSNQNLDQRALTLQVPEDQPVENAQVSPRTEIKELGRRIERIRLDGLSSKPSTSKPTEEVVNRRY